MLEEKFKTEQTVLQGKISKIQVSQSELERVSKDIYQFIERVKGLGLKLNSINHPSNKNEASDSKGVGIGSSSPQPTMEDGLSMELERIYNDSKVFLREFDDKIYPLMNGYLNYLESHI